MKKKKSKKIILVKFPEDDKALWARGKLKHARNQRLSEVLDVKKDNSKK